MAGVVVGIKFVVGAGVLVVAVEDSEINTWDILMRIPHEQNILFFSIF